MKQKATSSGNGTCLPPSLQFVRIYFGQKGLPAKAAEDFFRYHQAKEWRTERGAPIRNWKTVANNWIWSHQQMNKPQTIEVKIRLQLPGQNMTIHER